MWFMILTTRYENNPKATHLARRRHSDVVTTSLSDVADTSQVKHPTTSGWNVAKKSQLYLSATSYWNVLTTSQEDVTTTSHQYVSTTCRTSLKWNTQRSIYGTPPRRLISTSLVSRSLIRFQVTLSWPQFDRIPRLI